MLTRFSPRRLQWLPSCSSLDAIAIPPDRCSREGPAPPRPRHPRSSMLKPLACLSLLCFAFILLLFPQSNDDRAFHPDLLLPPAHLSPSLRHNRLHEPLPTAPSCAGRSVYIHKLPPSFNAHLLRQCRNAIAHWLNFCVHLTHRGLGAKLHPSELLSLSPPLGGNHLSPSSSVAADSHYRDYLLQSSDGLPPSNKNGIHLGKRRSNGKGDVRRLAEAALQAVQEDADWHRTDSYMLEVIFHQRLLRYPCLTDDPAGADAFFLPYYTGLDALNYLYGKQKSAPKMQHGSELVSWLQQDPIAREAWKKHGGRDHFLIMSRTPWDFEFLDDSNWGTGLLRIPEYANMTLLLVEKQPWMPNQHAIPYPTSFHPTSSPSLHAWIDRVRTEQRSTLFTFVGSIRPALMKDGIRPLLVDQCSSSRDCSLLDCNELKCSHNPDRVMRAFLRSQFCLQPRGDTPTRRSLFDSIIAGCIPVLFHKDTAYTQYEWHLPKEASTWSVYIDESEIRRGELIEGLLREYSEERILRMRETLITMMPRIVYAKDSATRERGDDAFDVSVRETLRLISHTKIR